MSMTGSVATIGFFDGVHRGHQFVIGCVAAEARRRGLRSVVVTFDRHPREVVAGSTAPELLTSLADKRRLIVEAGADDCEVLHFDKELAGLSAREFMSEVLRRRLGVEVLLLGYDNRFGRRDGNDEGFEDYVEFGRKLGIEVMRLEQYERISSSAIRKAIASGNVTVANGLLGRRYSITGTVVHGFAEGHKLGFPTANLSTESIPQLIPGRGVYLVRVTGLQDSTLSGQYGMMNIGMRPTFGGEALSVEVNILDYSGDLYGRELRVELVQRIREERCFSSHDALRCQLEQDRETCRELIELQDNKVIG